VNVALYLRRPLLILSKHGYNSTALAYSVANELKLGNVLYWPISRQTNIRDGLYNFDATSLESEMQLRSQSTKGSRLDIGNYIRLGPLGTALLPSDRPRVLVIDGIDRNIAELAYDLSHIIASGEFAIPELVRMRNTVKSIKVFTYDMEKVRIELGAIRCTSFPFVCIISYGTSPLPEELTNQCIGLEIKRPNKEQLIHIIKSSLGYKKLDQEITSIIDDLLTQSKDSQYTTDTILDTIWMTQVTKQSLSEIVTQLRLLQNITSRHIEKDTKISQYHAEQMFFGGYVQQMEVTMGDQVNISNVTGSVINIDSILENVSQSISAIPRGDSKDKDELKKLVKELNDLLKSAPEENKSDAEKMANRVDTAIKEATKDDPDKELIEFSLESLKKAASNIAALVPSILPIAMQIVEHIRMLA
jgi:MoxR-like ATPase